MNDPRPISTARIQSLPKQPPHSIEAEQSVLGGLLLNNQLLADIGDKLVEADFYRADHQLLYRGICEMAAANKPCDFVTLTEHLRHQGKIDEAGGPAYVASLAVDTYSISNVLAYAEIVRERGTLRGLIAAGSEIGDLGYRPEGRHPSELVEEAERKVGLLRERGARAAHGFEASGVVLSRVSRRMEYLHQNPGAGIGLQTGFYDLDKKTLGLHPGDLVITAARPGMGKTSFAMNIAEHVAITKKQPVAVFTMEMSTDQLMQRVLASYARVDLQSIRSGRLNDDDFSRLSRVSTMVAEAPLHMDETAGLSSMELRARARRLHARHGLKLIVVDYIQLMQEPTMRGRGENRTNELSEISRNLKNLAKELGVPIIAMSQLNRGVEARTNKRPRMSDLRESGGIEQDADLILMIYRDEVYDPDSKDKGIAEVLIEKQRSGPTGVCRLAFVGKNTKFDNLADPSFEGGGFE